MTHCFRHPLHNLRRFWYESRAAATHVAPSVDVHYDFSDKTAVVTGGGRGIGIAVASGRARRHAFFPRRCYEHRSDRKRPCTSYQSVVAHRYPCKQCWMSRQIPELRAVRRCRMATHPTGGPDWSVRGDSPNSSLMRRSGHGRMVNMGSLAGKKGLPNLAAYSAASAGVMAFTKALSREVCDTDIRVNCVAPGPIDTDLIRTLGITLWMRSFVQAL